MPSGFVRIRQFGFLANRISEMPVVEPPARDYQQFLDEVKDLGRRALTIEACRTLRLTDQERRSLLTSTAELATKSRFHKIWGPWSFESFMEIVELDSISPSVQTRLRDQKEINGRR